MARKVFTFLANQCSKPFANFGRIYIVVVNPVFRTSVEGRIDIDALHLASVIGKQRLQSFKVVALNQQIARVRIANALVLVAMDQPIRHITMMVHHRLLPDPIQCGH